VIAAVLALWILQQPVSTMQWLAVVIICGAVAFEALWPRLAARRAAAEA
jgi:drug/metabolite transporter (DMT)-like permease